MIAVKDFSGAFARLNRPAFFLYQPNMQQSADFMKSKLGDKVRIERFDGAGHALFVDDPENFDRVLEEFLHGLAK
jgi:pimeloyl-ACP methyl ester carboxylesterase